MKAKIKIRVKPFKLERRNPKEIEKYNKYSMEKCKYIRDFDFYIPFGYCSLFEYLFLKKAVKDLSPLTRPNKLADYLNVDIKLIYYELKSGLLPHFTNGELYSIKTIRILPFLKKYSIIPKKTDKKTHCGKH